jgi:uncharacterized damage-inducible protein DinB
MNKHGIQLLYEYNRWANARILGAAATLTQEQYLAPGKFPHGGLRGTLAHALFAEWVWRMRWQGTAPDYRYRLPSEDFPTPASLHARWSQEENRLREFVAALTDEKLNAEFDYTSTEGGRHRRRLWEAMVHVVNHGTQHRSEAAAMLTEMGHSPGDIDLIVFLNEAPR